VWEVWRRSVVNWKGFSITRTRTRTTFVAFGDPFPGLMNVIRFCLIHFSVVVDCGWVQYQPQCHWVDRTLLSSTVRRRRFYVRRSSTPPLQTTSGDVDVLPPCTRQPCRCHSLSATPLKEFLSVHRRQTLSSLSSTYVLFSSCIAAFFNRKS